ncbi:MAG TPA: NADH-quinone oxidoreductase subunit J [Myxococcaceae bacterium]|nr:NADH-quinone oxidoreductase subunit J [Myxococcaceae bacterium]
MSAEVVLFWVFAGLTVLSAVGVIVSRNPIASAMSLVAAFFFLAGIYVLLWAHTIAILQVLVYAGAVMVLFLFVIMLLSLPDPGPAVRPSFWRLVGGGSAAGLGACLVIAVARVPGGTASPNPATFGTLRELGGILYTQYLLPFEAVSLLLLVAMIGAVVVAKSRV